MARSVPPKSSGGKTSSPKGVPCRDVLADVLSRLEATNGFPPVEKMFCEQLFSVHRRQKRFFETIADAASYDFDPNSGVLEFSSGERFETQILGLETPQGDWMWAWADTHIVNPGLSVAAKHVCQIGQNLDVPELTTGQVNVGHLLNRGHTLAVLASFWRDRGISGDYVAT